MKGLTEHLAGVVAGAVMDAVPESVLNLAERAFVDTVGVGVAARAEPSVTRWRAAMGHRLPEGPSRTFLRGVSTQPMQAALANGLAAHALDFDDVSEPVWGHPSAVLIPAALAVGDELDSTGQDVLEAFLLGYQVLDVLARVVHGPTHYARGWHATSTLGTVAAAAAAARIYRLSVQETRYALGIAASMAAGSRQNFGTMTKPLRAGLAASNGVNAAILAAAGLTADPNQLEAPLGYAALMAADEPRITSAELDGHWALAASGLSVKKYPCCYNTHRALDAVLNLRTGMGLVDADQVEAVEVKVQPDGLGPLIHRRPTTGLAGKFSMEYATGAALLDGGIGLSTFTDEAVLREQGQNLLRRVTTTETSAPGTGPAGTGSPFAVVTIVTRDGSRAVNRVDVPRGEASAPLADGEIEAKFRDCTSFGAVPAGEELYESLRALRKVSSVRDVTRAMTR